MSVIVELKYFGMVITNTYIVIHVIQTNIYKILSFEILNSNFFILVLITLSIILLK